jgi:hypothetical protein
MSRATMLVWDGRVAAEEMAVVEARGDALGRWTAGGAVKKRRYAEQQQDASDSPEGNSHGAGRPDTRHSDDAADLLR